MAGSALLPLIGAALGTAVAGDGPAAGVSEEERSRESLGSMFKLRYKAGDRFKTSCSLPISTLRTCAI